MVRLILPLIVMRKYILLLSTYILLNVPTQTIAQSEMDPGQTIQIYTQLHSFVGRPSWLLMIRDVDNNQMLPYVFDFTHGNHFWVAFTQSRNYLIVASTLQFAPYRKWPPSYNTKKINNFCQLESYGRIIKGESLYIRIRGNLTPYTNTFSCDVSRYRDMNFTIVQPDS